MSIDEIIRELESVAQMFDSIRYRYPESGESGAVAAIREAIALLADHPDHQPNEPLTQVELRTMDCQPVYVVDRVYPPYSGWWIIGWAKDSCVLAAAKRRGTQYIVQNYGIDWVAYRRPPKEA